MEIEKGIPVPAKRSVKTGICAVIPKMEVGDSVFIATSKKTSDGGWVSLTKRVFPSARFTTRKDTKDGVAGVRLWRVS